MPCQVFLHYLWGSSTLASPAHARDAMTVTASTMRPGTDTTSSRTVGRWIGDPSAIRWEETGANGSLTAHGTTHASGCVSWAAPSIAVGETTISTRPLEQERASVDASLPPTARRRALTSFSMVLWRTDTAPGRNLRSSPGCDGRSEASRQGLRDVSFVTKPATRAYSPGTERYTSTLALQAACHRTTVIQRLPSHPPPSTFRKTCPRSRICVIRSLSQRRSRRFSLR